MAKTTHKPARAAAVADSLYQSIGGHAALSATVDELYLRILTDSTLRTYFARVDFTVMKTHMVAFLAQALGGPARYQGRSMRAAHARIPISRALFDRVAQHLEGALESQDVTPQLIQEVLAVVSPLAAEIVTPEPTSTPQEQIMKNNKSNSAVLDRANDPSVQAEDLTQLLDGMKGALDAMGTNVFVADRDLRLVYMNRRANDIMRSLGPTVEKLFGVSYRELIGTKIDSFHGNRAHEIRTRLQDTSSYPIRTEIKLAHLILDLNVNSIISNQGEFIGMVVNWEEISEKKKMEAANVDYAAQIAAISRAQAAIEFQLDGTILWANDNFLKTLGYSLDEIKGRHHSMFVEEFERQQPQYKEFWEKLNRGEYQAGEYRRYGKGGKEVWIQASYNPLLGADGKAYKVVKFATDITTQKSAMMKSQAYIEFQMDGTVLMANNNFLKTLNYSLDEIKGRHHSMFCEDNYRQSSEYRELWAKLNRGENQSGEYLRIGRGGTPIWIQATYNVVADVTGRPFRVVKYAVDITSRKQVETQIAQNASALSSSAEELTAISQQLAGNAEETATQANVVSAASDEVSKNVNIVAASSEEMQASIREISKNANEAARVAKSAVTAAEETNRTISKLGESSAEIGKVIKVITSIAQQTNLLALNATIEAARAGEAGKGFAVVANEVKELAKQTAKATEEIGQKIEAIQSDTKGAVEAIADISQVINQINDISNSIASAVEEQTVTTNEIGRNVNEAAKGTGEIANNIAGVATAARETTQGATDTQKAAQALTELAVQLQSLVVSTKS
jgi:methyl-accepting chemotaxis protein